MRVGFSLTSIWFKKEGLSIKGLILMQYAASFGRIRYV